MGCGSSGQVVPSVENGQRATNGKEMMANEANGANGSSHHNNDDLPTVVLPETPAKPRAPIAFEIPIEEFDSTRNKATTPPPHLQRLLQPPPADIKLPDIREKLAEAEQRRLSILQQRAASAQKRAQRTMKSFNEPAKIRNDFMGAEEGKHGSNVVTISPEPGVCEDKNI